MATKTEPTEEQTLQTAQNLFSAARVLCLMSWPYLNSAVMRLVPRWSNEVPTLAVDKHLRLYMNPVYVSRLDASELALIVIGHELQHVLGQHHSRLMAERDVVIVLPSGPTSLSNVCHDLAINSGLAEYVNSAIAYRKARGSTTKAFKMPRDALMPQMFRGTNGIPFQPGLLSEEYAELFRQNPKTKSGGGSGKGSGSPQCGKPDPNAPRGHTCGSGGGDEKQPWEDGPPDPTDPTSGVTQVELEVITKRVAEAAEQQASTLIGTVPGHTRLWAKSRLAPSKIPWRQILRSAVRSSMNWAAGRTEHTWARPCRRSTAEVILPGTYDPEPSILLGLDTSGSMGAADHDAAFREIHAVLKTLGRRKVPAVSIDAAVYAVQYIDDVRQFKMDGGGGTDMALGIQKALEMRVKLLILCTDGETGYGEKPHGMRVVVALTRKPSRHRPAPPEWARVVQCWD